MRGVIASESSNNAKEGGALVPTVAFGVPGSATMAILLGAFLIHGLVPGPDMLTKNLGITYAMVWSVALANILGAGLCYAFSPQFARLATLRYTLILPGGARHRLYRRVRGHRANGATSSRCCSSAWSAGLMKQFKWPRPPLILGVVLGDTIERYMFISIERYGMSWLLRPGGGDLCSLMAIVGLVRPLLQDIRSQGGLRQDADELPGADLPSLAAVHDVHDRADRHRRSSMALRWDFSAKIVPLVVGTVGLAARRR